MIAFTTVHSWGKVHGHVRRARGDMTHDLGGREREMRTTLLLAGLATGFVPQAKAGVLLTFEEISGDAQTVQSFYHGIKLATSPGDAPLVTRRASTNQYHMSSWPTGAAYKSGYLWVHGDVGVGAPGNWSDDARITFTHADATFVQISFCSDAKFWIEAYNSDDQLIDSAWEWPNLRFVYGNETGPGTIRVEAGEGQAIAYVVLRGDGDLWIMDNLSTDASGVAPEPAGWGMWLACSLLILRRRRAA